MSKIVLNGITWGHSRGITPLLAAAQRFNELHPDVEIQWKKRTLQEFADFPIEKLTEHYDLLIIDAFSSDAIPVHLLTQEAMRTYLDRCSAHGLIAFHISNRHIDLEPVLAALAREAKLTGLIQSDGDDDEVGKTASDWVVLARQPEDLEALRQQGPERWRPLSDERPIPVWTDDFSNLLRVFLWK